MDSLFKRLFFYTLALFPIIIIILFIFYLNDKVILTYTLDDPYIHLTLGKNIWAGHYGINPKEFSSPSSSILFPFLLAPFSIFSFYEYIPLAINIICLLLTINLFDRIFSYYSYLKRKIFIFSLLFFSNLFGLVFTGLEHNLLILLIVYAFYGFINFYKFNNKTLLYIFLFIIPLVRYEGLAISIPILVSLFFSKNYKKNSALCFFFIIITVSLFSCFLLYNGNRILPLSVIGKASLGGHLLIGNFLSNLKYHWFIFLISSLAVFFFFTEQKNNYAFVLLSATILHFAFGKYGSFGRYEVYYIIFLLLFLFHFYLKKYWYLIFFVPLILPSLTSATIKTPLASSNIYHQQYQMGEIVKMLNANVAVNDLGIVSLKNKKMTLDLWGLGSIEAHNFRRNKLSNNENWIYELMNKKEINYAIIYDNWFQKKPNNWIKSGELLLVQRSILIYTKVSFYGVGENNSKIMKNVLHNFKINNISKNFKIIIE
jgi:hypothetical protein